MNKITYRTTTGRYGASKPSDPEPPTLEGNYLVTLESSAAAGGILFWFWRLEEVEQHSEPPVHGIHKDVALCGAGAPATWPVGHRWSREAEEITCEGCRTAEVIL